MFHILTHSTLMLDLDYSNLEYSITNKKSNNHGLKKIIFISNFLFLLKHLFDTEL